MTDCPIYPLMLHRPLRPEDLIGTCFGYRNTETFVTSAHCVVNIHDWSNVWPNLHVGVEHTVISDGPMRSRTVRNLIELAVHQTDDIALLRTRSEYDHMPYVNLHYHNSLVRVFAVRMLLVYRWAYISYAELGRGKFKMGSTKIKA